ncbi:MAG: O-antigen ligase family protein [Hyphomicrobiales bacterium]|nr:O-antigen ligase family protein [Hyphomicrobiales bacterium]
MILAVRSLYIALIGLTFLLAKLSFGLPARSLVLVALFLAFAAFFPRQVSDYFERHIGFFLFCLSLTLIGFALTIYRGSDVSAAARFMNEEMIQVYLTFSCVYLACAILGPVSVFRIFIVFTMASGAVAILQFLGLDFAWTLREILSGLQQEPVELQQWIAARERALGLSYSTMNLGYQTISCLLAVLLMCNARLFRAGAFNGFAFFALLIGIATGVRSLLLAAAAAAVISNVLLLHSDRRDQRFNFIVFVLGAVAVLSLLSAISPELRIFSASDDSAAGRLVLAKLGMNLALDNPFGFGWGFDSRNYYWLYWSQLLHYQNADAAYAHGLHNYFLNLFLTYGALGALVFVIALLATTRQLLLATLVFLPYFLNSFFHNGGPFFGEIYFWFAYALFVYLYDQGLLSKPLAAGATRRTGPRPELAPAR